MQSNKTVSKARKQKASVLFLLSLSTSERHKKTKHDYMTSLLHYMEYTLIMSHVQLPYYLKILSIWFSFISIDTSCACEAVVSPNIRQLQISTRINNCSEKNGDQNNLIQVLHNNSLLSLQFLYFFIIFRH